MDYTATLNNLLDYYANLLIVQYNGKNKACATIKMIASLILASLLILQIRDAFNWKTAKGIQLDIIGKWLGVSRDYKGSLYWNNTFLSYPRSNQLVPSDLTDSLQYGYSKYGLTYDDISSTTNAYIVTGATEFTAGWLSATDGGSALTPVDRNFYEVLTDGQYKNKIYGWDANSNSYMEIVEGGVLTYENLGFVEQELDDENYRIVLGLKIIKNSINHTCKNIDDAIWEYFGGQVYTTWNNPHEVTYHYPASMAEIINFCNYKQVLLAPTGVSIQLNQI